MLRHLPEASLSVRPAPGKWSNKEIIGHLTDSAQNNIQRFIRAQYENTPRIVYDQNFWVGAQDYQHYPTRDLIRLWVLLNRHLCRILEAMPASAYQKTCDWGKNSPDIQTLEHVAADYFVHLQHHIGQLKLT